MGLVVTLFAIGILLLAIELVVPGAILGVAGGLAMLAGVVAAFATFGWEGGGLAGGLALAVLALVVYLELVWLPKSKLAKIFSMGATVDGQSQPPVADGGAVIGEEAVAETTLSPSGYVRVGARRYEAFCQDGYAAVGARLRVVSLDNFRLIVSAS